MTELAGPTGTTDASDGPGRTVHHVDVVPHTHWDREWYAPYPTFRLRLVELLDELLPRLDADPGLAHFQLDGQMAVVDDYLGLRPEEATRLQRLAAAGRLSMGPWYVLPDEFLVSGETHIRNLQLGLRRAADFGGAMRIGYLPDMFGHVAQMPQLLAQFGFSDAVVWRGVPSSVDRSAFWWRAPDGSQVRAEYLPAGYGNGSDLPADPGAVRERIEAFRVLHGALAGEPILLMAGMDHEVPPAHLGAVIAALDAAESTRPDGDVYELTICSLTDHLTRAPREDLPVLHGELRSGHRANVLMGVASNRVDVKQAAARAERSLERVAEPLAALWLSDPDRGGGASRWAPVFDLAWLGVIRNAAHDSICACSHDEVVDAVLHRYAEATRLADGVTQRAVSAAAGRMEAPGAVVLNSTARRRAGLVEIDLPGEGPGSPALQVLSAVAAVEEIAGAIGPDAPMRLAFATLAEHPETRSVRLEDQPDGSLLATLLPTGADRTPPGSGAPAALPPDDALAVVGRRAGEVPDLELRLVVHHVDATRHALALTPPVPGYGWARWEPTEPTCPVGAHGDHGLTNGHVTVEVDPTDGTFSIDGIRGFGRLVDDGDAGDTYNWCPPELDRVVDAPTSVGITVTERGPLRGRIIVESTYLLPERCSIDGLDTMTTGWAGGETYRRVGEVPTVVTTTVELRADDPVVRVTTSWDQRSRDHRLRVHMPLPTPTDRSEAEDAFTVVERPLWVEGGPNEWGVPTYPSRRFVCAGGLTVTHEGLCEYELVDLLGPDGTPVRAGSAELPYGVPPPQGTVASALALTLVRSTGWLSRGAMPSRPLPAGPFDRLEGAQVLRPLELRYALQLDSPDGALDPHALADHVWNPLLVAVAPGGGDLGDCGTLLEVTGLDPLADADAAGRNGRADGSTRNVEAVRAPIEVDALLRHPDGRLVLRAHSTGGHPALLGLPGRTGSLVDLRDQELDAFDGVVEVAPHRIVTVHLD